MILALTGMILLVVQPAGDADEADPNPLQAAADAWAQCLNDRVFDLATTSDDGPGRIARAAIDACAPLRQVMLDEQERTIAAAGLSEEQAEDARDEMDDRLDEVDDDLKDIVRVIRRTTPHPAGN